MSWTSLSNIRQLLYFSSVIICTNFKQSNQTKTIIYDLNRKKNQRDHWKLSLNSLVKDLDPKRRAANRWWLWLTIISRAVNIRLSSQLQTELRCLYASAANVQTFNSSIFICIYTKVPGDRVNLRSRK